MKKTMNPLLSSVKEIRLNHWENGTVKTRAEVDPQTGLLDGRYVEWQAGGPYKTTGTYAQDYRVGIHVDYAENGRAQTVLEYAYTLEEVLKDPLPRRKIYHNRDGSVLELTRRADGTYRTRHLPELGPN